MFKIDLTAAPQSRDFEIPASDLDLNEKGFSDIQVHLECDQLQGRTRMLLEVCAKVLLECDRTLREFVAPVVNTHELHLYPHGHAHEQPEDELVDKLELDPGQRMFDLTDVIRDTLMLAIPVRKVAPEAEHLQIQTIFGAQQPETDQRWSALRAVRDQFQMNAEENNKSKQRSVQEEDIQQDELQRTHPSVRF